MPISAKYMSVCEKLKSEILEGKYRSARVFPSSTALARRFKTTRATVRRALDLLRNQGLVGSRQGRGTFVTRAARMRTIGFIVPSVSKYELFPPILAALTRLSREAGYTLVYSDAYSLDSSRQEDEVRELARRLIEDRAAGVIFQPLDYATDGGRTNREVLAAFARANIPVVLLDSDVVPPPERSGLDLVSIDNISAAETLARHVIDCGAKRLCVVSRPNWWPNFMNRVRGVRLAVASAGLRWGADSFTLIAPDNLRALRKLMKGRLSPDAFVCEDDDMAAVMIQSLAKLGFAVPDDVMVAGFDDVKIAGLVTPPLTTMRQPHEALAATAFRRILERIARPELLPTEIFLPATLVRRASTRSNPQLATPLVNNKRKERKK